MKTIQPSDAPAGFSLIELLIVISIIAILAGLTVPVVSGVRKKVEKTAAINTAYQLKNAIASYYTDYRRYPVKAPYSEREPVETDRVLMDVLLGADSERGAGGLNPRGTNYFMARPAKPTGEGTYRSGLRLFGGGSGELWDPYGRYYRVMMDAEDRNHRITPPDWARMEVPELADTIIVWSAGRDGKDEQAEDNIATWR